MFLKGKNNTMLYIGYLPFRKKPCLAIFEEPNIITKVATFKDEERLYAFIESFSKFLGLETEELLCMAKEATEKMKENINEQIPRISK